MVGEVDGDGDDVDDNGVDGDDFDVIGRIVGGGGGGGGGKEMDAGEVADNTEEPEESELVDN